MEELQVTAQEVSTCLQVMVQVTVIAHMWTISQHESKHSSWLPPVVPDLTHGMPQRAVCQDIMGVMEAEDQDIQEDIQGNQHQLRRHPAWEPRRLRVT